MVDYRPRRAADHRPYQARKLEERETAIQNVVLLVPVEEQAARLYAEWKDSKASELPATL